MKAMLTPLPAWAANAIDAATVEEETTTGVKKAVVNGQLVIKSANGIFNMAGARIK